MEKEFFEKILNIFKDHLKIFLTKILKKFSKTILKIEKFCRIKKIYILIYFSTTKKPFQKDFGKFFQKIF